MSEPRRLFRTAGGRNLVLLGAGAILLAMISTSVELWLYRSSGDIYLDRSRPGYLPDKEEAKEETETSSSYSYPDTGPLDKTELGTYLTELKSLSTRLDKLKDPYNPDPLTDESLGITTHPEEAPENSQD